MPEDGVIFENFRETRFYHIFFSKGLVGTTNRAKLADPVIGGHAHNEDSYASVVRYGQRGDRRE